MARLAPEGGEASSLPEARIDLSLDSPKTGTIRGIVTDLSGMPVAGAMVQLAINRFEPAASCRTCQDGSFAFIDIPAGMRYWLYAAGKGLAVSDSPPLLLLENQEILHHIRLSFQEDDHRACLAGRITGPGGLPAALSAVLIFSMADEVMDYHSISLCDESGRYMAADLAPGPYLLRIISEGFPPVVRNLLVTHRDGLIKLDFALPSP